MPEREFCLSAAPAAVFAFREMRQHSTFLVILAEGELIQNKMWITPHEQFGQLQTTVKGVAKMPVMHQKDLWKKPAHTEMKHRILQDYLEGWFPILSKWNGRVAVIDGFAGPGQYLSKDTPGQFEPGSPVIIIDTVLGHKLRDRFAEIVLLFIEKEPVYASHLERLLQEKYPPPRLGKIKYEIVKGDFATTMQMILSATRQSNTHMVPCFAFIDPFGPGGIPMRLIGQFMENPSSEVLINFPFDIVNRFLSVPPYERTLDDMYGCGEWRDIREVPDTAQRHQLLHELYIRQLKAVAGARHVLSFTMRDGRNRALYHLVFGSKNHKGLDLMKQTMWRADPSGSFQFSDYRYNPAQMVFFPPTPDYEALAGLIWAEFHSRKVGIEEVERWVVTETDRYASNHVRKALTIIEEQGRLQKFRRDGGAGEKPYTRKRNFPPGTVIHFAGAD